MAKQTTVTVGKTEYTLQHPGARWYFECIDRNKGRNGHLQIASYTAELLENVVIEPRVTMDDFDDNLGELMELTNKVESFLTTRKSG